jgi:hypothetical protein
MVPISPVVPGHNVPEVVYAKDQPQYQPLPVVKDDDGTVVSRWKLTWRERLQVLFGGSIWLTVRTFNRALQPVQLSSTCPVQVCQQCEDSPVEDVN